MRLGLLELVLIVLACVAATICEWKAGPEAAWTYFYNAPWFIALLAGLAVTLIAATLLRWPWAWNRAGFVTVHFGIVLLLVGAVIGRGSEASFRLHLPAFPSGSDSFAYGGFQARLLRFEVLNEGDAIADFRSTVRFTDAASGETLDSVISMNNPARFPPGLWRTAFGFNHTIFQAEWNPEDLGETTLRVVRDPGWPFKWMGSLMLCLGLAGLCIKYEQ